MSKNKIWKTDKKMLNLNRKELLDILPIISSNNLFFLCSIEDVVFVSVVVVDVDVVVVVVVDVVVVDGCWKKELHKFEKQQEFSYNIALWVYVRHPYIVIHPRIVVIIFLFNLICCI